MRIALVTTTFLPVIGGAQFCVHHLARQWCRQGHDVRVFNTVAERPSESNAGYSVERYRVLRGAGRLRLGLHRFPFCWFTARDLSRRLQTFRPEVVSGHFAYPTAFFLAAVRPPMAWISLTTLSGIGVCITLKGPWRGR
jgi:nucleoside-diphosphate-sugar epimerase